VAPSSGVNHTPGPWDVAPNFPNGMTTVCQHDGKGWRPVATCAGWDFTIAQHEANARLIAAAPELLEAMERISEVFDAHCEHHVGVPRIAYELANIAKDAIAALYRAREHVGGGA
jgi:hypothetical protein